MLISVDDIVFRTIDAASHDLRKLSLSIHDNPELALNETHACKAITDYLKSRGFKVEHSVAGLQTAFVASYVSPAGAYGGLRIGFCSEYDALPGLGHACGHNLIAISGIAMFLAISAVLDACRIPGTVRLFGTPAEENVGGKIIMQKAGVFDGSDLLMIMHPTIGYSGTWHSQCCQKMSVEYFGKASHSAAAPWDGINAGTAASLAQIAMGATREQLRPDWRANSIITTGGEAANIIPEYSRIECIIRASWAKDLRVLEQRTLDIFRSAALATGCTHKVTTEFAYLDNQDNPVLGKMYEGIMREKYKVPPTFGQGASTDFGNLSQSFISLHGNYDLAGTGAPNHTSKFAHDARTEKAHENTLFAAKTSARVAARCVVDGVFWEQVKKAHADRLND
ncbi:hypothetical protein DL89DRAFT_283016 [Linderina pennispora]|uniref:Peptidase M20 domain-containing protein 2 n=1 Tax=Linderina pennispora TaxID=61395 RepID=A0A1Y1WDP6_9FUNG|nr:uncharacterized protein DL89DRAFT_283016 [Linderina pennispora]ORX71649.1 hypothetical protein DL89DRAFT_283016 [Linderina pennispora]